MGEIISPVSDKTIFDEFEKEFEEWAEKYLFTLMKLTIMVC